jgi:hypothetical protein
MGMKKMLSVIKWPNGFFNVIRVEDPDGAMLENEINMILDEFSAKLNIPREDIKVRLFSVEKVEIKDKL